MVSYYGSSGLTQLGTDVINRQLVDLSKGISQASKIDNIQLMDNKYTSIGKSIGYLDNAMKQESWVQAIPSFLGFIGSILLAFL